MDKSTACIINLFDSIYPSNISHNRGWALHWQVRLKAIHDSVTIESYNRNMYSKYDVVYIITDTEFTNNFEIFGGGTFQDYFNFCCLLEALEDGLVEIKWLGTNKTRQLKSFVINKFKHIQHLGESKYNAIVNRLSLLNNIAYIAMETVTKSDSYIIGDVNALGYANAYQNILLLNNMSLNSFINNAVTDFIDIDNIKELVCCFGHLDVQWAFNNFDDLSLEEVIDKYFNNLASLPIADLSVCKLIPSYGEMGIEFVKSIGFENNCSFGTNSERKELTKKFNILLEEFGDLYDIKIISPPKEWYEFSSVQWLSYLSPRSPYLKPIHYITKFK